MASKLKITQLKAVLKELEADESSTQLVVNTAQLYNTMLERFLAGEKVQPYILTGLCGQVFNQLLSLKKLSAKKGGKVDDKFTKLQNKFFKAAN